jgi:ubiquinone/menaquinone biosynthesis C-methylase UbiE
MTHSPGASYLLGDTSAEHERLIRQATVFEPFTERLFRDAGIDLGQRVLDIGSGVGDVALIVARIVGPSGEVFGVERDAAAIALARGRVTKAKYANVSFIEADVADAPCDKMFDAVVGRLILEYLPDPGGVLRSLCRLVRPGGIVVFQDACWGPLLQLSAHLPLRAKCAAFIHRVFERSGAHMNMELVLYRALQEAGLPAPNMLIEVPVGDDPYAVRWVHDLVYTLLPRALPDDLTPLGDLNSLESRLEAERVAANSFGACAGLVGAWSRKPG